MKKFLIALMVFIFITLFSNLKASANNSYNVVEYKKGLYVIEIDTNKTHHKLMPAYVDGLETNEEVYNATNANLVVNAGFFDPKTKLTVSYVIIDGVTELDPEDNYNLTMNKNLEPYLDKILNRSEFRILKKENGEKIYDIAPHDEPVAENMILVHSIQAGPMLYPDLRLEEEFFVLKKDGKIISESASSLHRFARTAIGIRDNKVYLFIATKQCPLTLEELGNIAKEWNMEKAMAFDGGGSTSIDCEDLHVISDYDNQGRKLKSFLILK